MFLESLYIKPQNILSVIANIILLNSNSNAVAMAYVDVKLFHSYICHAMYLLIYG